MKNTHSLQKKRKPEFPKNTELIKEKRITKSLSLFFSSSKSKKRTPETVIEIVLKRGTMK